jgi:hypothetical protein
MSGVDLAHWHKVDDKPSAFVDPPPCCRRQAEQRLVENRQRANQERRDAVHAERRRVVKDALAATEQYAGALASVLVGDQAELATKVMSHVREAIRSVGCICPMLDVSTFGDPPGTRMTAGGDPDCGVHA